MVLIVTRKTSNGIMFWLPEISLLSYMCQPVQLVSEAKKEQICFRITGVVVDLVCWLWGQLELQTANTKNGSVPPAIVSTRAYVVCCLLQGFCSMAVCFSKKEMCTFILFLFPFVSFMWLMWPLQCTTHLSDYYHNMWPCVILLLCLAVHYDIVKRRLCDTIY